MGPVTGPFVHLTCREVTPDNSSAVQVLARGWFSKVLAGEGSQS